MAQQRSAIAFEPFLALAPSATSPRAAVDLITQATSAPHVYSFAELLQKPNIQKLRHAESKQHRAYLKLLEIFAWGTWQDYSCKKYTFVHCSLTFVIIIFENNLNHC